MLLTTYDYQRCVDQMFCLPRFIHPILIPNGQRNRSTEIIKHLIEQLYQNDVMLCAVKKKGEK